MECNKEEATRAKALAEKKLQMKDFQGARKIALKAQQLFSDLENISQMLMVCDVHCSAEKKISCNETDWYGILQVEQTADEAMIKKQYRKFALQLHPDKNKFPGAEAAFKLVGEAQRVLLDREKRKAHDKKRNASVNGRASAPYRPPPKANFNPNSGFGNNFKGNFPGFGAQYQAPGQPAQSGFPSGREAFWTMCPFCSVRYQYYRDVVNRSLSCQNCHKNFVAYDLNLPGTSPLTNNNRAAFPQQSTFPKAGFCKVETIPKQAAAAGTAGNRRPEVHQNTFAHAGGGSGRESKKRRRKLKEESSESIDTESSTDSEEDLVMGEDGHVPEDHRCDRSLRRSTRQRHKVSYNENVSDDDNDKTGNRLKSTKGSGQQSANEEDCEGSMQDEVSKSNRQDQERAKHKRSDGSVESIPDDDDSGSEASSSKEPEPGVEYPDPDFIDFDKDRRIECFEVGQVWAAYDTLDGMPRFYAIIRKVRPKNLKLDITWLEPHPDDENEIKWVNAGLPVSCGKFTEGGKDTIEHRNMFSHFLNWGKGRDKKSYTMYPWEGETWAIFRNWDIDWYSDPDNHKKFEYEFVEILSAYTESNGILVAYLDKIKGFASVFVRTVRKGVSSFYIRPSELYRFAHKVPSVKLDDKEGEGVPKGSFELDPLSVPLNLEEIDSDVNGMKVKLKGNLCDGESTQRDPGDHCSVENGAAPEASCSVGENSVKVKLKGNSYCRESTQRAPGDHCSVENRAAPEASCSVSENSATFKTSLPQEISIPDSEFHNFDADKSHENFKVGQIWAVYSDEDFLPKYYGKITKVNTCQEFELHMKWLGGHLPDNVTMWHDRNMLISCGIFKVKKDRPIVYTDTDSLSHLVKAEPMSGRVGMFAIFPEKGEVWALYRNWNPGMTCSGLANGEYQYDIVEVTKRTESQIEVLVLERVDGYNSVYKPCVHGCSKVTLDIPKAELLRFSHQVPASRLTTEKDGSLRGFLELDAAALPAYLFGSH